MNTPQSYRSHDTFIANCFGVSGLGRALQVCSTITAAFSTWHLAFSRKTEDPLEIYRTTAGFPRQELYGITSQIRRCSVSIGANIAEGCGKPSNNEFQRFLQIASGSASELDYHLVLAYDLEFLPDVEYRRLAKELSEVRRMLTALLCKVDSERKTAKLDVA